MRKSIVTLLCLFALCALSTTVHGIEGKTNADAFWPGGGFVNSKYAQVKYYVSGAVTDLGYIDFVNDAFREYDSISNADIGFLKTSGSESMLRIVMDDDNTGDYSRDAFGYMLPFKYDSNGTYIEASNYETWVHAKIWLNDWMMDQYRFTPEQRNKTVLHEIGHVFAMDHQYDGVSSVMVSGQISYPDLKPLDISNLQWKY